MSSLSRELAKVKRRRRTPPQSYWVCEAPPHKDANKSIDQTLSCIICTLSPTAEERGIRVKIKSGMYISAKFFRDYTAEK